MELPHIAEPVFPGINMKIWDAVADEEIRLLSNAQELTGSAQGADVFTLKHSA